MEFGKKLQTLRQSKGLTQEELADLLYVSRAAVSKWESGRGYPNIDSLKAISKLFSITIDNLLSGEELLTIAEEDTRQQKSHLHDLVFGLLDCSIAIFFFLPLFGQTISGTVEEVSLLSLSELSVYMRIVYFVITIGMIVFGILTLALQNSSLGFWLQHKRSTSLILNALGTLLFIISLQPYAATFLFIYLIIKVLILFKQP